MDQLTATTSLTKVVALPLTTSDLLSMRKSMRERTLNDHVDDIHVNLWGNPAYRQALEAVYDEDAVEGSLAADNFVAAGLIRDYAREHNNPHVKGKKLATIVKALGVVLKRYGISRQERKVRIGDEAISMNGE